eukprot:Ihof_evm2s632 gene=Ihof_evmTU2s632
MGGCCCKRADSDEPNEATRLLKDRSPTPGRGSKGLITGEPKELPVMDEPAILQAILDNTANELIDVNRVTSGIQLGKRDYVERENQYRQTLNLQTNSRGQRPTGRTNLPVLSCVASTPDTLYQLLATSPHLSAYSGL